MNRHLTKKLNKLLEKYRNTSDLKERAELLKQIIQERMKNKGWGNKNKKNKNE